MASILPSFIFFFFWGGGGGGGGGEGGEFASPLVPINRKRSPFRFNQWAAATKTLSPKLQTLNPKP